MTAIGLSSEFANLLVSVAETDLTADVTLGGRLLLNQSGELTVFYAPFDYIQRRARLVIVGITPGEQQARNALVEARRQLIAGSDWPAPGSADTELGVFMEPEVSHGETEVYPRVQA